MLFGMTRSPAYLFLKFGRRLLVTFLRGPLLSKDLGRLKCPLTFLV